MALYIQRPEYFQRNQWFYDDKIFQIFWINMTFPDHPHGLNYSSGLVSTALFGDKNYCGISLFK